MSKIETRDHATKIGLGTLLVLASILGGNTGQDINSDIILIATFGFALFALRSFRSDRIAFGPAMFCAAALLAVAFQFTPVGLVFPRSGPGGVTSIFLTYDVLETLRVFLTISCVAIIFLAVLSLSYDQATALMPFLFVGLLCNLLLGLMNFSAGVNILGDGLFPYPLAGGFFINDNHFSTYMLMFIPFVVFEGIFKDRFKLAVGVLLVILVLLLAARSLAGVSVAALAMVLSAISLLERRKLKWPLIIVLAIFAAIYLYGLNVRLEDEASLTDAIRIEIWTRTLQAIWQNLTFGVGYGAFTDAYTAYQLPTDIRVEYINHAHNDYLELIMEGGLIAAALIVAYGILLLKQTISSWGDPLKRAAAISIVMLLITSLVDYPGRTYAVLFMFAFANAILFHVEQRVKIPNSRTMKVSIDGVEKRVPIRSRRRAA